MSHTKGPWEAKEVSNLPAECGDDIIRNCYPGYRISSVCAIWNRTATTKANARLIAAAPELLKACEELLRYISADNEIKAIMYPQSLDYAKAIIAKATGAPCST